MTTLNPIPSYISDLSWADSRRAAHFQAWLTHIQSSFNLLPTTIVPASADASFRRYFRILSQNQPHSSYIIMDAPPDQEDAVPFVSIADLMKKAGLHVPEILNWDKQNGFILLTDLGSHTILQTVHANPDPALAHSLFKQAITPLIRWQLASKPDVLPPYNEALLHRELNLFPEWYIAKYRQTHLTDTQKNTLDTVFQQIIKHNLASPQTYVHRDYMPRNLMVGTSLPDGSTTELGILDFQDAVYGPITYDIASLMRDAFHTWDEEFVLDITIRYWEAARKAGLPVPTDFSDFWVAVEWMGLQRHLKILGIFARLTIRDGKPKYLADTPRFIHYVRSTCERYHELRPLLKLIDAIEKIQPQYSYQYGR